MVLVADDDAVTRRLLEHHLTQAGMVPVMAQDGEEAENQLSNRLAAALFDLQMPKRSGLECLASARKRFPDLPVLVISQFSEVRTAVQAMKQGAFEYITKPIDPDELLVHLHKALNSARLAEENRQLREAVRTPTPTALFVGASPIIAQLMEQAKRIAPLDSTILITGESGTGKSTLARIIHQLGPRSQQPFVAVSCAALPRDLIEAELFGHAKGAFTGATADRPGRVETAHQGTLFLDEIGDLPLELQPKLLTFLQDRQFQRLGESKTREVDVRVIAATHQDLPSKCKQRQFREDLFFRLAVLPLEIPALNSRPEDIVPLVDHLLVTIAKKRNVEPYQLTEEGREVLLQYQWPGNVRELENVLERATAFCQGGKITPADLALQPTAGSPLEMTPSIPTEAGLAGRTLADIERQAILETLQMHHGNKKASAKTLGIDEKTIHNKIKKWKIELPD